MLLIKNFLTSYTQNLFNILTYSIHIIIVFICVSLSNRWVNQLLDSLVSENRAHAYDSIIPHFFRFVNTFSKLFYYIYIFL